MVYIKLALSPGLTWKSGKGPGHTYTKFLVCAGSVYYVINVKSYGYVASYCDDSVSKYADSPCQGATIVEGYVSTLVPKLSPHPDKI